MFERPLSISDFYPSIIAVLILFGIYYLAKLYNDKKSKGTKDFGIFRSGGIFSIVLIGVVVVILILPLQPDFRKDLIGLIGIVISAILALSSATFMGNGLAGVMLRAINNFKPGDFIEVNEFFGRVTERGLFHTEIQTETRDLTTIPNLYLTTNPVKVIRMSGTFITGVCSLGYDVNRQKIEKALLDAGNRAGLTDSFVRVKELGDYSVVYSITGLVENIKTVLSAQSRLNAMILDALHDAQIEIVSPTFMNQRQVGESVFIPKKVKKKDELILSDLPETKMFDKAEEAESIEKRKEKLGEVEDKIKQFNEALKIATEETEQEELKKRIENWIVIKNKLVANIENKKDDMTSKK
ncbi:MAG: mechanosensitive ion channel domain-containing protein [Saprospiraceae bacterium]